MPDVVFPGKLSFSEGIGQGRLRAVVVRHLPQAESVFSAVYAAFSLESIAQASARAVLYVAICDRLPRQFSHFAASCVDSRR
jgi:hypothetical protein